MADPSEKSDPDYKRSKRGDYKSSTSLKFSQLKWGKQALKTFDADHSSYESSDSDWILSKTSDDRVEQSLSSDNLKGCRNFKNISWILRSICIQIN